MSKVLFLCFHVFQRTFRNEKLLERSNDEGWFADSQLHSSGSDSQCGNECHGAGSEIRPSEVVHADQSELTSTRFVQTYQAVSGYPLHMSDEILEYVFNNCHSRI